MRVSVISVFMRQRELTDAILIANVKVWFIVRSQLILVESNVHPLVLHDVLQVGGANNNMGGAKNKHPMHACIQ